MPDRQNRKMPERKRLLIHDAETSSGSSTEVNSTDAENASDANAYYSESEDTSSQDDTGIYGIPYGEEETYYTE